MEEMVIINILYGNGVIYFAGRAGPGRAGVVKP